MKQLGDKEPFFIGWAAMPRPMQGFMLGLAACLVVFAGVAAYVLGATQGDPGNGGYLGSAQATGILEARPYPVLYVTQSDRFASGTALILSGAGKNGVQRFAEPLDGKMVRAEGVRMQRGNLDGIVLSSLSAIDGKGALPERRSLGRWRLTGEICDGKCLNGTMRPGRGLAHKACANLCLLGGVAPVFVSTDKVDGTEFFLMGDASGGPLDQDVLDHTAVLIEVEGRIEQRGSLKLFLIDPTTIRIAR